MTFVTDMAAKRAELSPDRTAFVDVASGVHLTFGEVEERANRMARALMELGARRGDRVALLARNHADVFVLLFASQKSGVLLLPLNWRQPAAELAPTVALAAPVLLLHDEASRETAQALGASCGLSPQAFADARVDARTGNARFLEAMEAAATTAPSAMRIDGDAPWYLLATSGTTGTPKLVIQTATMAWANAVNYTQATDLSGADKSVNFLPLFHTAGINLLTLPLFLAGGMSRVLERFDPRSILSLIGAGEITAFFGVPAIYQALALEEPFEATDFSRVRSLGCGGAPMPAPLLERYLARGVTVCNGMGMTETGPTVFLADPARAAEKIGSVGKAQMLADVRLVDASGHVIEGEGEGELQIRGPGVTPGYYANEEATAVAFADGGWLRSGDIARRDADGYFSIVDRIKDMYISGGENVYPAEVERVLVAHPDILEAIVVGVPDERWGETGAAWLIPRPGCKPSPGEIVAWCRERIAGYKVPQHIEIAEDLPRTAAGKVQKHVLRELHLAPRRQQATGKGKP
jgi:fatty-acyl-CoA synthase